MSVEDLVISLTIKEGGKLDDLRKQLDSIFGKKGAKTPDFAKIFKVDFSKDLTIIKRKLDFLVPTVFGTSIQSTRRISASTLKVQRATRGLTMEKIKAMDPSNLFPKFGLKMEAGAEALEKKLEAFMDDVEDQLELGARGIFSGSKANLFASIVGNLQKISSTEGGRIATLIDQMRALIKEKSLQNALQKVLQSKGLTVESEKYVHSLKESILKTLKRDIKTKEDIFKSGGVQAAEKRERKRALTEAQKLITRGIFKSGIVTKEQKEAIQKSLGLDANDVKEFSRRLDLFVSEGALKLPELFENQAKKFTHDTDQLVIETKALLSESHLPEVEKRLKEVLDEGKSLAYFAYGTTKKGREGMKALGVPLITIGGKRELLEKFGIKTTQMPDAQIDEVLEKTLKEIQKAEAKSRKAVFAEYGLESLYDKLESSSDKDKEEIIFKISGKIDESNRGGGSLAF